MEFTWKGVEIPGENGGQTFHTWPAFIGLVVVGVIGLAIVGLCWLFVGLCVVVVIADRWGMLD